jgi:hypothetical protein
MKTFTGRTVVGGQAKGKALVTRMPMNFTASFSKVANLLPWNRSQINDRHHELFKQKLEGRVLIFPAAIGSTFTGMVVLQLIHEDKPPAAMVVRDADSLLVAGIILARTWFNKSIPVLEVPDDAIFDAIQSGDEVEVDGEKGTVSLI